MTGNSDPRDYKLEIPGLEAGSDAPVPQPTPGPVGPVDRCRFVEQAVRIWFSCCNQYMRIPRAAGVTELVAHCPKCGGRLVVNVEARP